MNIPVEYFFWPEFMKKGNLVTKFVLMSMYEEKKRLYEVSVRAKQ